MHKPDLGKMPMTLRDIDVDFKRRGELLLDYSTYDLYYVKNTSGETESIVRDIYNSIVNTRLRNTKIKIVGQTISPSPTDVPSVSDRTFNTFYVISERSHLINA